MVIETGIYQIVNAEWGNVVRLPDGNKESEVQGDNEDPETGDKWIICKLRSGRYTIRSYSYSNYATIPSRAPKGSSVIASDHSKQWEIEESRVNGRYNIASCDSDLFWILEDGEGTTPVTVSITPNDPRSQWILTKSSE